LGRFDSRSKIEQTLFYRIVTTKTKDVIHSSSIVLFWHYIIERCYVIIDLLDIPYDLRYTVQIFDNTV